MTIKLDQNGIQALLNGAEVAKLVKDIADTAAGDISSAKPDAEVVVDTYTATPRGRFTERAAASVTVRDVRAKVWQAREGLLTRPFVSQGLEVTEKP